MKYLTRQGLEKLQKELEERKTQVRRYIALEIKEAKEQGDLSENAEYTEAKRKQRENESRIMELENLIRTSKVAESGARDKVGVGSKIEVEFSSKKMTFEIVGPSEVDPLNGRISNESPIGKSFLGRKKGEKFEVTLPNGNTVVYKVLSIS